MRTLRQVAPASWIEQALCQLAGRVAKLLFGLPLRCDRVANFAVAMDAETALPCHKVTSLVTCCCRLTTSAAATLRCAGS